MNKNALWRALPATSSVTVGADTVKGWSRLYTIHVNLAWWRPGNGLSTLSPMSLPSLANTILYPSMLVLFALSALSTSIISPDVVTISHRWSTAASTIFLTEFAAGVSATAVQLNVTGSSLQTQLSLGNTVMSDTQKRFATSAKRHSYHKATTCNFNFNVKQMMGGWVFINPPSSTSFAFPLPKTAISALVYLVILLFAMQLYIWL